MKVTRFMAVLAFVHLGELIILMAIWLAVNWQARMAVSRELGIGNALVDFESYIDTQLVTGITRRELIERADAITTWRVKPFYLANKYCETISFYIGPFDAEVAHRRAICYDENFKVTSITSAAYQ